MVMVIVAQVSFFFLFVTLLNVSSAASETHTNQFEYSSL
jgi:hypothetical protein